MRPGTSAAALDPDDAPVFLLALATGPAQGHAPDLAGPEVHPLATQVRQVMRALGRRGLIVPVRPPGRTGTRLAHGALLPTGPGPRGDQTFGQWLAEYAQSRRLAEGVGVASRQP